MELSTAQLLTVKDLVKQLILNKKKIARIRKEQISVLKNALFSSSSKRRKYSTILLLYLSHLNSGFLQQIENSELLHNLGDYVGISLNYKGTLENREKFCELLKKDPHFRKREERSNGFLFKYMMNFEAEGEGEIHLVTMTELRYHIEEDNLKNIPDPLTNVVWYYKEKNKLFQENFKTKKLKRIKNEKSEYLRSKTVERKPINYERKKRTRSFMIHSEGRRSKRIPKGRNHNLDENRKKISFFLKSRKRRQKSLGHQSNTFINKKNFLKKPENFSVSMNLTSRNPSRKKNLKLKASNFRLRKLTGKSFSPSSDLKGKLLQRADRGKKGIQRRKSFFLCRKVKKKKKRKGSVGLEYLGISQKSDKNKFAQNELLNKSSFFNSSKKKDMNWSWI